MIHLIWEWQWAEGAKGRESNGLYKLAEDLNGPEAEELEKEQIERNMRGKPASLWDTQNVERATRTSQ